MLLFRDGKANCSNCSAEMSEETWCLIKWPGIGTEEEVCQSCANLFSKWRKTKDIKYLRELLKKEVNNGQTKSNHKS